MCSSRHHASSLSTRPDTQAVRLSLPLSNHATADPLTYCVPLPFLICWQLTFPTSQQIPCLVRPQCHRCQNSEILFAGHCPEASDVRWPIWGRLKCRFGSL